MKKLMSLEGEIAPVFQYNKNGGPHGPHVGLVGRVGTEYRAHQEELEVEE